MTCPRPLAALFSKGLFALLAALTHTSHAPTPTAAAANVVNEAFDRETQSKSGDSERASERASQLGLTYLFPSILVASFFSPPPLLMLFVLRAAGAGVAVAAGSGFFHIRLI